MGSIIHSLYYAMVSPAFSDFYHEVMLDFVKALSIVFEMIKKFFFNPIYMKINLVIACITYFWNGVLKMF